MLVLELPIDRRPDDEVVESIAEVANTVGLSIATVRREIKKPDGPVVTRLSTRRLGITRRHRREWLARRSLVTEVSDL